MNRSLLVAAAVALAPATADAGILYAVRDSDDRLRRIDTQTLAITDVGPLNTPFLFGGLGWDATTATLYAVGGRNNNALYRVDTSTGAATFIGTHGVSDLFGLEVDDAGDLYGSTFTGGSNGLYRLNKATGAATAVTTYASGGPRFGGLAFDTRRDQLVGIRDGDGTLFSLDRTTGAASPLGTGGPTNDSGLAYDPDQDVLWDIDHSGNLFRYDPNTGYARTTVLTGLGAHDALAYVVVPEPAAAGLGVAAAAIVGLRRRRRAR